jgi:hypothetical protein
VVGTVFNGHVPLPRPGLHFWTAQALDPWPGLEALGTLAVLAGGVVFFRRAPAALATFAAGQLLLLAIAATIGVGFARHHGHALVVSLAAAWLAASADPAFLWGWRTRALTVLLMLQLPAAAYASVQDLRLPFSQSQAAARFIAALGEPDLPIVTDRGFSGSAVSALLPGRPFYYPSTGRFEARGLWNAARPELTPADVTAEARRLARASGRDALLVLNYALPAGVGVVHPLARLEPSIVGNESFWLYRVPR